MSEDNILGVILAGGRSKRMGKDKLFIRLNDKTLIEHSIDKVKKYLKHTIIITDKDNKNVKRRKKRKIIFYYFREPLFCLIREDGNNLAKQ